VTGRSRSVVAIVAVTTLALVLPSGVAHAATPACFGQPATIVGTSGIDTLVGTAGADVIVGLGGDDEILGEGGDDLICGGGGNDSLEGESGSDMVSGGPGSDSVANGGSDGLPDVLHGDGGPDTFKPVAIVGDAIDGGTGTDVLNLINMDVGMQVDLLAGTATAGSETDSLAGIDNVIGTDSDDWITGDAAANRLQGRLGNDAIPAGTGTTS
jgi:Ca2+-binding RTX toxin-like protein